MLNEQISPNAYIMNTLIQAFLASLFLKKTVEPGDSDSKSSLEWNM